MVKNIKQGKELVVISESKPGVVAKVAQLFADRGIDIIALSAQVAGGVGLMNFVVDEHLRAKDLLRKSGYSFRESDVILLEVEDKPGVLLRIAKKLAAKKIDVLNIYGSSPASYANCLLVISTSQNQKAFVALKK